MIRIAICDDQEEFIDQLTQLIYEQGMRFEEEISIDTYHGGIQLCQQLEQETRYDLIFLDIMMPEKDGIYVGNLIRQQMQDNVTQIVYISTERKYAMDLFQVRPMDFLIKPLVQEEVEKALLTAYHLIKGSRQVYTFEKHGEYYRVPVSEICYVESSGRMIILHTAKEQLEFYGKLEAVYEKLEKYQFLFIHKSYLVNYAYVRLLRRDSLILNSGKELPISRNRRDEVRKRCYTITE